jgi:sulfopyruvate decarboxylase subunit beta
VVQSLARLVTEQDLFVSSIGGLWDDWWNHRPGGADNTFSPGILGSVSSTALGLALALPHRRIVALETDGSMLLNTGILCTLGNERPPNLTVIIFDNQIYENIGGPPTHTARNVDLAKMAEGAGCVNSLTVRNLESFSTTAERMLTDEELGVLVAKIQPGKYPWPWEKRKPTDGIEDKYRFMRHMERLEGIVIHPGAPQN